MNRSFLYSLGVALAALTTACVTSPIKNERLTRFDPTAGYRLENMPPHDNNSNSLFVILTFSGGGQRAAAFAYGVLETLRDTPIVWNGKSRSLLEEVDVISSVSGGSITAAYYGMARERTFDEFPEKVLYDNLQRDFFTQILTLNTYRKLMSTGYTRSCVLADELDRNIFEGKTFGDLLADGTRPLVIINATDVALASRFGFTQDQFDELYSDLSSFKIGHAVAASALVPAAFPPMMLTNYERGEDYRMPDWATTALDKRDAGDIAYKQARTLQRYEDPDRRYIHVSDGGLADNLGLLPIIQGLLQVDGPSETPMSTMYDDVKRVVIITVNAKGDAERPWNFKEKPLGFFKSIFAASNTRLDNHTDTEIMYMQLLVESLQREADDGEIDGPRDFQFIDVSFDYIDNNATRAHLKQIPTNFRLSRGDVDLLRKSARDILNEHIDFQAIVESLQ